VGCVRQLVENQEALKVEFERCKEDVINLPWAHLRIRPFPQIAIRMAQISGKENVQLHQLSELILSDPAFASEVLTIANSALYSPRFPSSTIIQAITVLGANNLQGICLTVAARAYLGKALDQPAMCTIWRHNMACALLAEQLATVGFIDKDLAYTCGIMHDIGRLALATIRPKEYAQLLSTHKGTPQSILEREQEIFGWNHCDLGQRLVHEWNLPGEFEPIVSAHHRTRPQNGNWQLPELIDMSCRMADAAGFAAFPGCEVTPFAELLDELPARERRLFHPDMEALNEEISGRISAVEVV
jgi:putative nucleotidyltransferase with HDIG domain